MLEILILPEVKIVYLKYRGHLNTKRNTNVQLGCLNGILTVKNVHKHYYVLQVAWKIQLQYITTFITNIK